ncbi:S9 family peptidase [Amycolatopsis dendrobii]|uniref:Prolyl oligopeptidase family serine peptidase n=1 Tax=Amycolatopsis dendrobii TaxID=2760662 RepID=A0A7W3ZA47_9PSEU|nr:alpha/beta hydrolase [Amycolatopsis dendrobii]MBB1153404.1 prolyl oligopeptidase family serine peptidase [Amycolatopsis dendrobii]
MSGLTAELVVDGRAPQTPALAPNGQLLCYVLAPLSRTGDHLDTELWLVGTDGTAASRQATSDTATESRPRWSEDSGTLFFLSDRADRGTSQVHRLVLADGAAGAVTDWRSGIVDYLPLADPNLVALLAWDEPTEHDASRARDRDDAIVVGEREPRARLRLLDLRTGLVTTPEVFGDRHVVELRQRPGGGPLAVLTQASSDNDYASRVRTPVLLLHGAEDTNVPLGQSVCFHRALRHFGVEHEFVIYPREGHSIRERHHQLDVLFRARGWFDRWLRF